METNENTPRPGRPPLFESGTMKKYKLCLDAETVRKARALSPVNELSDGLRRAVAEARITTGPTPEPTQEQ